MMLIFLFMALFFIGCGDADNSEVTDVDNSEVTYGYLTDERDGKKYRTVEIGNLLWMADNLNYETDNSMCYNDDDSNCAEYGRLYTWATALDIDPKFDSVWWNGDYNKPDLHRQGVCPNGWRVPNDLDWADLMTVVGDSITAGKRLKSETGWDNNGNGTNDFGFSALPAGFFDVVYEDFINIGRNGLWWSVSDNNRVYAYFYGISNDRNYVGRGFDSKFYGFSVRCVSDLTAMQ